MAKYKITYKCGHEGTVELFGKYKDRDSRMKWMSENMVCPDCYREKLRDLHDVSRIKYRDYKYEVEHGNNLKTVPGTYDPVTKTIEVYEEEDKEEG